MNKSKRLAMITMSLASLFLWLSPSPGLASCVVPANEIADVYYRHLGGPEVWDTPLGFPLQEHPAIYVKWTGDGQPLGWQEQQFHQLIEMGGPGGVRNRDLQAFANDAGILGFCLGARMFRSTLSETKRREIFWK